MRSPPSRVILFDDIPTVIPSISMVAPETSFTALVMSSAALVVETTIVASPVGLCGLVPYSDSDSDSPDEMASPKYITLLPATSPFLSTDSPEDSDPSEASDSSEAPPSQDPYVTIVARWRSRATEGYDYEEEGSAFTNSQISMEACITSFFRPPHSSDHLPSSSSLPTDSLPVHSLGLDAPVPMVDEEIVEPIGGDSSSSSGTRDGTVRIVKIETTQRKLEADQMITSGARAGMAESIRSLRSENLKVASDDLRGALFVLYLTSAHLRRSFDRFMMIVMTLREGGEGWSHSLRGVWDSAYSSILM
uniref:Uncharacterized protein n=1 Tax=Tanacetum cinerariifolium TaxID=118510 RepID=A0A6L2KBM8_TANCI|nr:hypothetical protein [Tanacetum cinerariifolium]